MIEMEQHLDFEKKQKQTLRRGRLLKGLTYFFLTIWALIVLFPFYWMILTSVKSYGSYNAEHVPAFFTLSPYPSELQRRLYNRASCGLSAEHPDLCAGYHSHYGSGQHPGGLCLCPAGFPGKKPGLHPVPGSDDDPPASW